jgi:hypothetical protein
MNTVDVEIIIQPKGRGKPRRGRSAQEAPTLRIPRIARLMALSIKFQDMVDRGEVRDYADLAALGYVSRARLTQIMNLTLLAPDIQEELLDAADRCPLRRESGIRRICKEIWWPDQRRLSGQRDVQRPLSMRQNT